MPVLVGTGLMRQAVQRVLAAVEVAAVQRR
jgi:hypothetical protein